MSLFRMLHGKPITIAALNLAIANLETQIADKAEEISRLRANLPVEVIEGGDVGRVANTLASVERERDALLTTYTALKVKRTSLEEAERADAFAVVLAEKRELGAKATAVARETAADLRALSEKIVDLYTRAERFRNADPSSSAADFPPISRCIELTMWALTAGLVGRESGIAEAEALTAGDIERQVKEFVELTMRLVQPAQEPETKQQDAPAASITTGA